MLAVCAAVLHDMEPMEDPCVALLVVAFATGSLTKQVGGDRGVESIAPAISHYLW